MTARNFDNVMKHIFTYEGGYVDHPNDPGGATNMGITIGTLRAYRGHPVTKTDVRNLTKTEASEIYRRNYWNKLKADHLPQGYDLVAMDGGVNSGVSRGAKWLQQGVGAKADGAIGAATIDKARGAGDKGIKRACEARMTFLRGLRIWSTFGRGWSRRVASVEALGVRMWLEANATPLERKRQMNDIIRKAPVQAKDARRAGNAQAGTTGAAGAGSAAGSVNADVPWEIIAAVAVVVVIVAALLVIRARRKAEYHEDREQAYIKERENLK